MFVAFLNIHSFITLSFFSFHLGCNFHGKAHQLVYELIPEFMQPLNVCLPSTVVLLAVIVYGEEV